jgi:predicted SAM-dependent methyltransferase
VGCGSHYHPEWTNVDFYSTGPGVIAHNLLKGIPFESDSFNVVYHSHVLEHFSKIDGVRFISECFRVLKPGGTIRIAIPDLNKIITEYQTLYNQLKNDSNNKYLNASYDWIMIELFDQCVRNSSGGEMLQFLRQEELINKDYVIDRCGYEVKSLIEAGSHNKVSTIQAGKTNKNIFYYFKRAPGYIKQRIKQKLLSMLQEKNYSQYQELGKFRLSGEIHQWMYDEFSIKRLLAETGFKECERKSAFSSNIPDWSDYKLEIVNAEVRKPDSLFIEAVK